MAVRIESQAEPIPGYKLIERLGGGGFGEVWKAEAPGGLLKAIKFVYGDLQAASDEGVRAEQELKALSRVKTVRHPYILSLERYDIIEGQLIIVMELADRNLWDRFKECRAQGLSGIPREELLRYMEETAEALDLMNTEYQLQHLDIKPQNLFLVHNHAKVADFGLVKDLQGMMASVTGGVTPVYAAPETFDGWVSRFSDQYSLGIVYQELLTGQRPFSATNVRQLILQHLQAPPNVAPLPAHDREAIGRALAKNPDERFPTCLDLVRVLRAASESSRVVGTAPVSAGIGRQGDREATSQDNDDDPTTVKGRAVHDEVVQEPPNTDHGAVTPPSVVSISDGEACWIRIHEAAGPKRQETAAAPALPPEIQGDGVLFPALVIGLGELGREVLQRLRAYLQERFGPPDALPNIRLLYVDTDPEAPFLAAKADHGAPLGPQEVLLAKLNRPSHYLKSHDGRARIDGWFSPKMLYRIPRSLVTSGMRPLGRLAFLDNYRLILRRLRTELGACSHLENLQTAATATGLGLHRSRPRVYVVTGLAGGTGSGIFLDLAYVLRQLLKAYGCEDPDIVGIFLLPAADRHPGRTLALGNAFAALTELYHFSVPGTTFSARYNEKEKALTDPEAPYNRCILLPLPEGANDKALWEVTGIAADFLARDLTAPLGRTADQCRAGLSSPERPSRGPLCQSFGLYRVSWPRQLLLRHVAGNLCQQLLQRWMTKDATAVRPAVQALVAELRVRQELDGEHLLSRTQQACEQALGQPPETMFALLTEPLAQLDPQNLEQVRATAHEVRNRLEQIVGRPEGGVAARSGSLAEQLKKAAPALTADWGQRVAGCAVHLIEQPEFRLAGAEEAVRQLIAAIEQVLAHYEPLCKELTTRAAEAYEQIAALLKSLQANKPANKPANKRQGPPVPQLTELLRVYAKWRSQGFVLQCVITAYVSLRGHLSEQLREINFCRTRLNELVQNFASAERASTGDDVPASGRNLFPAGCRTLPEAIERLLQCVSPEDLRELDARVQDSIQKQYRALVHICLSSTNLLKELQASMQREAEDFVAARLTGANVAEMFLEQYESDEHAQGELCSHFSEAAPLLAGPRGSEICILATPVDEAGQRFRDLACQALTDVHLVSAPSLDDIIFYREVPQIALADLEQLGPLGYEAYRQMLSLENFTPHSRTDITEWRAAGGVTR
jgi:serine/threonine protein kinase